MAGLIKPVQRPVQYTITQRGPWSVTLLGPVWRTAAWSASFATAIATVNTPAIASILASILAAVVAAAVATPTVIVQTTMGRGVGRSMRRRMGRWMRRGGGRSVGGGGGWSVGWSVSRSMGRGVRRGVRRRRRVGTATCSLPRQPTRTTAANLAAPVRPPAARRRLIAVHLQYSDEQRSFSAPVVWSPPHLAALHCLAEWRRPGKKEQAVPPVGSIHDARLVVRRQVRNQRLHRRGGEVPRIGAKVYD
jgi:hypothetical protein